MRPEPRWPVAMTSYMVHTLNLYNSVPVYSLTEDRGSAACPMKVNLRSPANLPSVQQLCIVDVVNACLLQNVLEWIDRYRVVPPGWCNLWATGAQGRERATFELHWRCTELDRVRSSFCTYRLHVCICVMSPLVSCSDLYVHEQWSRSDARTMSTRKRSPGALSRLRCAATHDYAARSNVFISLHASAVPPGTKLCWARSGAPSS